MEGQELFHGRAGLLWKEKIMFRAEHGSKGLLLWKDSNNFMNWHDNKYIETRITRMELIRFLESLMIFRTLLGSG